MSKTDRPINLGGPIDDRYGTHAEQYNRNVISLLICLQALDLRASDISKGESVDPRPLLWPKTRPVDEAIRSYIWDAGEDQVEEHIALLENVFVIYSRERLFFALDR